MDDDDRAGDVDGRWHDDDDGIGPEAGCHQREGVLGRRDDGTETGRRARECGGGDNRQTGGLGRRVEDNRDDEAVACVHEGRRRGQSREQTGGRGAPVPARSGPGPTATGSNSARSRESIRP